MSRRPYTRQRPVLRDLSVGAIVAIAAWIALAGSAAAGTYTVRSCDAAPPSYSSAAWQPQSGSVNTYKLCPSATSATPNPRGMVTRAVGQTFPMGAYSRLWFFAPAGTTIARLDWAGRMARNNPSWAMEIRAQGAVDQRLIGFPAQPGATSYTSSRDRPHVESYPAPAGTTRLLQNVQCGARQCDSGATFHTYHAAVVLNDHSPPAVSIGGIAENEWVGGDRAISFTATDNIGIKRAQLYVDHRGQAAPAEFGCDYTVPVPCANHSGNFVLRTETIDDGSHLVEVLVHDGSNTPAATGRTIRVDNTPPAPVRPAVAGGEGWRRVDGFPVSWPSVADAGSPLVGGRWELCKPGRTECRSGSFSDSDPTGFDSVRLGIDGAFELRVALRDQAGNQALLRDARPVALRLDRQPPELAIEPFDPASPMRATARAVDGLSGVASGQIEMQRQGTGRWRELPTTVEGGRLVARIDDERYADGTYQLRARAIDHTGNEASTYVEASGARATRQLPLRVKTRLHAGRRTVRVIRRVVVRGRGKHRRRRVVRRRRVQYRPAVTVRYRRRAVVRGRLANPDGQPLYDVPIEVTARPRLPGAAFAAAGIVRTDQHGRFSYRVRGTRSRTLRFRYPGTSRIRPSTVDVAVRVPASSSFKIRPRRIVNGETVTLTGRVRGGPIPAAGKLVELRKWTGSRWEPFRVVRTDPQGHWKHVESVGSVTGIVSFRLRARLPAEAGFPYRAANTRPRKLVVAGRGL